MSSTSINKIASFAILNLEISDLPDRNLDRPNIIKIVIHCIGAEILSNESSKLAPIPRVHHQLTLFFKPPKQIHSYAEKMSGLDNSMLDDESPFDNNAATVIINFLKHLQQPVCLVAHDGDIFDFPHLKHALDALNVNLPSDVRCIDSLIAFRKLDKLDELYSGRIKRSRKHKIPIEKSKFISLSQESITSMKEKYNLESIYYRRFDEVSDICQYAEADVIKLEKIILSYGNKFVEYADAYAKPVVDIDTEIIFE